MEASGVLHKFSALVGSSEAGIRLLLSVMAGYPVAHIYRKYVYRQSTNPNTHHLYFLLTGLSLGYFNYGNDIVHPLLAVLVTYATLVFFSGTSISVAITFVFNMSYLLMGYYYVGTNNYDINWTMPQCIVVLRLIGLAFDLYDGAKPIDTLSNDSKKVALQELPNMLETLGFTFFPTSFLVGPQFPLKRYQEFVAGKFSDGPGNPPNSVKAASKRCLLGVMFLVFYLLLGQLTSDSYIESQEFAARNIFLKLFHVGLWGRFTLYKYISCWLLTEGACILFGITYNGEDEYGTKKWNGVENVKVSILENATEFNHYILSFNINTNSWVAQYVYKRLKYLGNRLVSQAISLLFLAVWHGFHSGYYVCFAFEFVVMFLEKEVKPSLVKSPTIINLMKIPFVNTLVYILLRMYTFVFMGWCLVPFALLTYNRYWPVFGALYYIGFFVFGFYPFVYKPISIVFYRLKRCARAHED